MNVRRSEHLRIVIATCGSRGDQQPVLSLASYLRERGHQVVIGGPSEMRDTAVAHGLAFTESAASMLPLLAARGVITGRRRWWTPWRAIQNGRVVVRSSLVHGGGTAAAIAGKPFLHFHFSPQGIPSPEYPPPGLERDAGSASQRRAR